MVDGLVFELLTRRKYAGAISLYVRYSKDAVPATGGTRKLPAPTDSYSEIFEMFDVLFSGTTRMDVPIRQISISFGKVEERTATQPDMFGDVEHAEKERDIQQALLAIKQRYGKNSVLRGMSYTGKATARMRNTLVGGHNGGE